jgi:hypothetical protein
MAMSSRRAFPFIIAIFVTTIDTIFSTQILYSGPVSASGITVKSQRINQDIVVFS